MTEMKVPVPGGSLTAWRSGEGAPALVLHGGPGLNDDHELLADELDGMYESVRFQQRGIAPSDAPGPYSVDLFVGDCLAVMDAAGWSSATVIGHSWGGLLAQHIAAQHPERVDALIAISSLGGLPPDGGWGLLDKALDALMPADISRRAGELDQKLYKGEGTDEDMHELLTLCWPYYFAVPESAPPLPNVISNDEVYSQVHASALELYSAGRPEEGLRRFEKPALFIHGRKDPAASDPIVATAEIMPNARVELIEGCGHFPWLELPGAIRDIVQRWRG